MKEILHQLIGGLPPLSIGFQPSQVVQDFFHPQYFQVFDFSIYGLGLLYIIQGCSQQTRYVEGHFTCGYHLPFMGWGGPVGYSHYW